MSEIRQKIATVFAEVMNVPTDAINDNTSPETLAEWDSLSHVQLIQALEEAFKISIAPDEGIDLETFTMVLDFVQKKVS